MSFRPELVECWVFRVGDGGAPEFLLMRRAAGRIYAGLWQCVTGRVEPGELVPIAALREVAEETGLGAGDIEAFYDLDQVASFYDQERDEVVSSVIFAARVARGAPLSISAEHDAAEWVSGPEAVRRAIWPTYRDSIERIAALVEDPERARYMAVGLDGRRTAR